MNTVRLRQARRLFTNELAERSQTRHNIRAWVRCIRAMGDSWVYAKTIDLAKRQRSTDQREHYPC